MVNIDDFIKSLIQKTNEGCVEWKEANLKGTFSCYIANNIIRVSGNTKVFWYDMPITMQILSEEGETIITIDATMGSKNYGIMKDLYDCARFVGLNVEETVKSMIKYLEDLDSK